ncbi:MAG TPA: hypothetical protein ENK31_00035 [Nannocystis exedens]|nr:hypothetical protein [Nannocystis exedens]
MTPSAPAPTTTTRRGLHRFAWAKTWLLPPLLGFAVLCIYVFSIVPVRSRPWYVPPRPKPGKSIVFRSLNRSAQAIDEATIKAERKARIAKSRAEREARKKKAKKNSAPKSAKDSATDSANHSVKTPVKTPAKKSANRSAQDSADHSADRETPQVKNPDSAIGRAAALPAADPAGVAGGTPAAFNTARPRSVLDSLERRYGALPLRDEPIDEGWASAHKALHFQLFALIRDRVFEGAPDGPELSLREVNCHSLRCELVFVTPYAYELPLITEALASLRWRRRSLWRSFVRAGSEAKTVEHDTFELHLVVAFAADLIALHDIQYEGSSLTRTNSLGPTGATHR